MATTPRQNRAPRAFWRGVPVAVTVVLAVGYVTGVALFEDAPSAWADPWLVGVLVLTQAALLLVRERAPLPALIVIASLDAASLLVSSGEAGAGTFAVMVAVYSFVRRRLARPQFLTLAVLAAASIAVTFLAVRTSTDILAEWALPYAIFRSALAFAVPVVVAGIVDGRERFLDALRERADAAERERERLAEDAVREERALMARELHDIAAHHMTGIIVSAQAADALCSSDPEGAKSYIRRVEGDARTALSNLRQTVGLLRSESGSRTPTPSIEQLPALVSEASGSGAPVSLTVTGTPVELGPLAAMAAYRMVQESLANAAQHAPGALRTVQVDYDDDAVRLTVGNLAPAGERNPEIAPRQGYGLQGMAERADLIGGTLSTGPAPEGGWVNRLEIPYDSVRA